MMYNYEGKGSNYMKSKFIDCKEEINIEKMKEAAQAIREGSLVLFPTETVYGIGASALSDEAVENIFKAKGRAQDNPLIVHISSFEEIKDVAEEPNEIEKKLIKAFCPGPFTIILKVKPNISKIVTANLDTVGIRMPSNKIAHDLIKYAKVPIAAPSANISGRPSGTKVEDIIEELDGKVKYIIDGGEVDIGIESTVVRVIEDRVHILRPGKITPEDIENLGLQVEIDKHILEKLNVEEKVLSPGMKYRHYAPKTKCVLVYSEKNDNMVNKINELSENENVLVIGKSSNLSKYIAKNKLDVGETEEEIAHNIFSLLRKVDKYNVDLVIIEGISTKGIGLAINNRLIRACEYNYIKC